MENAENQGAENYRYIVRVANTDLNGAKQIYHALKKIKGISFMYANMVCSLAKVDKHKKTGVLTEEEVSRIDDVIKNPLKYNIPSWMMNRRKDYETGEDQHLITSNLTFARENDIKRLKKIRSFRGTKLVSKTRGQGAERVVRKAINKKPAPSKA